MSLPYIRKRKNGRYQVRPPAFLRPNRNYGTYTTEAEAIQIRDQFLSQNGYRLDGTQLVQIADIDDTKPHIKKEQRANTMTLESVGRIVSAEQLIELADVDLGIWRVERQKLNKWEVGAKSEYKDLSYEDGRVSGTIKSDGLEIAPLIQVIVWLVRKKPLALFPTIQPIAAQPVKAQYPEIETGDIQRALVFGDSQIGFSRNLRNAKLFPFHDRQAMDLCVRLAAVHQPHVIVHLGDVLDMTEWTDRFVRMPEFTECTQPAILEAFYWFSRLRSACPYSRIIVLEGNHDKRMQTAIVTHLRAAYDLRAADELEKPPALSMPRLLAFDALDIEWRGGYPDNEIWLNDFIRCIHSDVARAPGGTSKTIAWGSDYTTVYGHIHRREWVERNKNGREFINEVAAFSPGGLCHIDGRVPGHSIKNGWQQGAALIEWRGDLFNIAPIRFKSGQCLYQNRLLLGEDNLSLLREHYPAWNW